MQKKKAYFAANWKMNHLPEDVRNFTEIFLKNYSETEGVEVIIFPQAAMLSLLLSLMEGQRVKIGSQNHSIYDKGAYTGELSPSLTKNLGCEYALVGHSERRNLYGKVCGEMSENDECCFLKVRAALENGLKPMLCVGENLEERNAGRLKEILERQISAVFKNLPKEEAEKCLIAYEPIWAIGTGTTASAADADEACLLIKEKLKNLIPEASASKIPILYGGSANQDNAAELIKQPNVDGLLIGGSSLKADSFLSMIRSYQV